MRRLVACFIIYAAVAVVSVPVPGVGAEESRLVSSALNVGGRERAFELFIPSGEANREKRPIVVVLHGAQGCGAAMRELLDFNQFAERDGFMVLYPDAAGPFWNDGRDDPHSPSYRDGVDDVEYIERLVAHVVDQHGGDPERVYVAGFSNGGMMALRVALDVPEIIAAVASVSGTLPKQMARRERRTPVPLLLIHGTDDRTVPWSGGRLVRKKKDHGEVLSVLDTFLFWAWNNGCAGRAGVAPMPGFQGGDGTRSYRLSFECDDHSRETVLVAIQGGGHGWPGAGKRDGRSRTIEGGGEDAVELICKFFMRHRKK